MSFHSLSKKQEKVNWPLIRCLSCPKTLHEPTDIIFPVFVTSNTGAGQQCCYTGIGNLLGPPNGGSLDRFHIEEGIPVFSHFFHDILPYLDCCVLSENFGICEKYFEKRPSDDGSRYAPPRPGNLFT